MSTQELREPRAVLAARALGEAGALAAALKTRSQFDFSRELAFERKSSTLCCVE